MGTLQTPAGLDLPIMGMCNGTYSQDWKVGRHSNRALVRRVHASHPGSPKNHFPYLR